MNLSIKAAAFCIILLIIAGCSKAPEETRQEKAQDIQQEGMLKGVSLSPKSFQPDDFTDFFKKAGSMVSWAGDWNELRNDKGGPFVVTGLSKQNKYIPLIMLQFFTQSTGKLLKPMDEAKEGYKKSVVDFAGKYKPKYLGMGIEVNMLYEKSPAEFEEFVIFYNDAYDAVKAVSPDTKVFTIFQLEKMKGMNGGLFGGKNDASKAEWLLLEKFKSDIAAFTTYPGLIYKSPSEMPADYYAEIKQHTGKPIAFTEAGWHSAASPKGWESSEAEQAEFAGIFIAAAKGLDAEFAVWSFLYDQSTIEPFNTMGFFTADGKAKESWAAWNSS